MHRGIRIATPSGCPSATSIIVNNQPHDKTVFRLGHLLLGRSHFQVVNNRNGYKNSHQFGMLPVVVPPAGRIWHLDHSGWCPLR